MEVSFCFTKNDFQWIHLLRKLSKYSDLQNLQKSRFTDESKSKLRNISKIEKYPYPQRKLKSLKFWKHLQFFYSALCKRRVEVPFCFTKNDFQRIHLLRKLHKYSKLKKSAKAEVFGLDGVDCTLVFLLCSYFLNGIIEFIGCLLVVQAQHPCSCRTSPINNRLIHAVKTDQNVHCNWN